MKIGILGSGAVGKALAEGFSRFQYEVMMGSRNPEKLNEFKEKFQNIRVGDLEDTAKFGELLVLCVKWDGIENVINLAGKKNFVDKVVIDVTNPLKFDEEGKPPKLSLAYPESGGKKIQEILSDSKVVKAFNIVTASYMANPKLEEGVPDMFIVGNNKEAKLTVAKIARNWGWSVHDLGNINQSYLLEALAMTWIRYGFINKYWQHAFKLLKK